MKGLLLKDFYTACKNCRSYLLLITFFSLVSFWSPNALFVSYPCMIFGMLPMTLYAYDENEKWEDYFGALPCTKAQFVWGKYLFGLLCGLGIIVLTLLIQSARMLFINAFSYYDLLQLLIPSFVLTFLIPSLLLPPLFRFGATKGRIIYYLTVGILCGGGYVLSQYFNFSFVINNQFLFLLFPAVAVIYVLSGGLSVTLYKTRE